MEGKDANSSGKNLQIDTDYMVYFINKGNIFRIQHIRNFAHGCNCAGAMGKGIALQFRKRFPLMYQQYQLLCRDGKFKPGDVFDYHYEEGAVFNLGTQATWREKARMEYIETSIRNMLEIATKSKVRDIAMPAIGAGLGGMDWDMVKETICALSHEYPCVDLYVVEQFCDIDTKVSYVKKYWDEENITFYLHFVGEEAVRQIEIHSDMAVCLSDESPIQGEFMLYDQDLSSLDLSADDFISKSEFDSLWDSLHQRQ